MSVQVARAIFGVGAPEALLVGVVALVVFGPKGLIEVHNLCLLASIGAIGCLCSNLIGFTDMQQP
jgi:hypothetical protein